MLKEHDVGFRSLYIIFDLLIIAAAFLMAYYVRDELLLRYYDYKITGIYPLQTYLNLLPIVCFLWIVCLHIVGSYRPLRGRHTLAVLRDIAKAGIIAGICFAAYAYITKLSYVSRLFIVSIFMVTSILLIIERFFILYFFRYLRKKGYNYRHMVVVGTGARAQLFINEIQKHPEWGYRITGLVDEMPGLLGEEILGHKIIGTLKDLPDIFERHIVDEIVFVVPRSWLNQIEEALLYCEKVGKRVSLAVDLFTLRNAKVQQADVGNFPLLMFQTTSDQVLSLFIKRALDIVLSLAAIVVLMPFFILMALLVKLTSKGPIVFKQVRCSLNGRVFTLYKFRTMIVDAEAKLENLRQHNEMSGPVFKMTKDPRITRWGKWMRKFSIDELPQLFNVLKGDMSFVGPRPPIPHEVKRYEAWQRRRLSMRPGLTCIWQIEGRRRICHFEEWMNMDLSYIDQWSLWLDLKLFLSTIPVVLFGIGGK